MKKNQKEYEKQIKINQNNDMFTTYQKPSHSYSHQHPVKSKGTSSQQSQHIHIQSLKNTLKSIHQVPSLEITKPIQRKYDLFLDQNSEFMENIKYNLKLNELSKNLQEIASKCHFSPANTAILKNKPISSNSNHNQNFQLNSSFNINQLQKSFQATKINNEQNSILNKSNSLFRYNNGQSITKNKSMHIESHNISSKDLKIDKGKVQLQMDYKEKSRGKELSEKNKEKKYNINQDMFKNSYSKNLSKIFQADLDSSFKNRERANSQSKINKYLYKSQIHRHGITNILISDHIYTASMDYTINKLFVKDQQYIVEKIGAMRGGVNHIGFISNSLYSCSKDSYLRSVNGLFSHKFSSIPLKFYELQKNSQISMSFYNKSIAYFDLEKRAAISLVSHNEKFEMIQKNSKQIFIAGGNHLSIIDWRNKHHIINIFRANSSQCSWMSDPCSFNFCYHQNNQIFSLDQNFKIVKTAKMAPESRFKTYDWNRNGLYVLGVFDNTNTCKVWKYDSNLSQEQIDIQKNGDKMQVIKIRDKKIVYGSSEGQLLIKSLKR